VVFRSFRINNNVNPTIPLTNHMICIWFAFTNVFWWEDPYIGTNRG